MLSIEPRRNSSELKRYFEADFGLEDLTQSAIEREAARSTAGLSPTWHGKGAELLQLPSQVTGPVFNRLCDNQHPLTLEQLTPRVKLDRIAAYEFTFSLPKGVSLLHKLAHDERIVHAARTAVHATMREVERHMRVRVRLGGVSEDRLAQNLSYALFVHQLARPENQVAEPQLHIHALAMNIVRDHDEHQWKAGKFFEIKKNAVYYETVFHRAMQREMRVLGYELTPKGKFWDVADLPEGLTKKFSTRNREIRKAIERDGVTNPKLAATYSVRNRPSKLESVRGKDLRNAWDRRLDPTEREWLRTVRPESKSDIEIEKERSSELLSAVPEAFTRQEEADARSVRDDGVDSASPANGRRNSAADRPHPAEPADTSFELERPSSSHTRLRPSTSLRAVVRYTAQRIFERSGVVAERDFIQQVLNTAPRAGISVDEVRREMETLRVDRRTIAQTPVLVDPMALADEKRLVDTVIAGRGQFPPLLNGANVLKDVPAALRDAFGRIAGSCDLVTVVEASPGDGARELLALLSNRLPGGPLLDFKGAASLSGETRARSLTPTLREGFVVLSPSAAGAREGLREAVTSRANTVERFLSDPSLRTQALRGVVLVDQAHLLTTGDTNRLLKAVQEIRGRLVLASEESLLRPNGPGNVPRILWEAAAIKPSFIGHDSASKSPVAEPIRLAARGNSAQALDKLKQTERVTEVLPDHVATMVASEYLRHAKGKWKPNQSIVVTPTVRDGERYSEAIRGAMKERGLLGKGKQRDQLVSLGLPDAAKRRTDTYKPGMVIEFNEQASRKLLGVQVSRTYKPGDRWTVLKPTEQGILIGRRGRTGILPLEHADKFGVYEKHKKELSAGDVIRFTHGTKARTRLESVANQAWGLFKVPRHAVESGRSYIFERYTRAGHMQVSGGLVVPKDWGHWVHDYARSAAQAQGVRRDHVVYAQTQAPNNVHSQRAFLSAMASAKKSFVLVTDDVAAMQARLAEDRRRLTPIEAEMRIVPPRFGLDEFGPRRGRAEPVPPVERDDLGRQGHDRDTGFDRG